jgi:hypothetical protein
MEVYSVTSEQSLDIECRSWFGSSIASSISVSNCGSCNASATSAGILAISETAIFPFSFWELLKAFDWQTTVPEAVREGVRIPDFSLKSLEELDDERLAEATEGAAGTFFLLKDCQRELANNSLLESSIGSGRNVCIRHIFILFFLSLVPESVSALEESEESREYIVVTSM